MAALRPNSAMYICEISWAHMTNEVPYLGFQGQETWSGGDAVLGGVSLAHIAHGLCNPEKDAAPPWWLDPTTVCQKASPQLEGDLWDQTRVIHLTFTHFISSFSPWWHPRPVLRHLPSDLVPHFYLIGLPLYSLFYSSSFQTPPPPRPPPPTLMPFWWTVETKWFLAVLTPTILPGSPEQEMIGQQVEGTCLMGPSTVCCCETQTSLLTSPPRASPPI